MYPALTALSVAGILSRHAAVGRAAGLAWTVFDAFHLAFHLTRADSHCLAEIRAGRKPSPNAHFLSSLRCHALP